VKQAHLSNQQQDFAQTHMPRNNFDRFQPTDGKTADLLRGARLLGSRHTIRLCC